MKNILTVLLVICVSQTVPARNHLSASANNIKCSVDTLPTLELITYLQQMDINIFYGKPVDSFLLSIPANFYNLKVYGGSNSQGALFRANYLSVSFVHNIDGPGVNIYVREYTHMNRYSPTATWDVNLFRQEKIYKIEVYKDQNTCINGWCLD